MLGRKRIDPRIKELDDLCREVVFARARWTCEKCGRAPVTHTNIVLQPAHFVSRGVYKVRWAIDNVYCLCSGCHRFWAHFRPGEFSEWVKEKLGGQDAFDKLLVRSRGRDRRPDYSLVKVYLQQQLKIFDPGVFCG